MLEQTLPVAFAVGSVMFALARLTGRAADPATEVAAKEGSAILLTEDFKLAHLRAMPRVTFQPMALRAARLPRRECRGMAGAPPVPGP